MNKLISLYDQYIGIRLSYLVLLFIVALLVGLSYKYYAGKLDDHTVVLFGGVIASFIAVLFQFLMDWNEHREIEKFKRLGIRRILPDRREIKYYRDLLCSAKKQVDVLGVTANRFLTDFADKRSTDKVLIDALNNCPELKVRILLPAKDHLQNQDDKDFFDMSQRKLTSLSQAYQGRFDYAYFTHLPIHSIVRVDEEVIIGPVFPHVPSKHTPSIHITVHSDFVKHYLDYFENEWNSCPPAST